MGWITSQQADDDLQWIAEQGIERHGVQQARRYTSQFIAFFDLLALNPKMGPERTTSSGPVRLMPCGRHHIVYVERGSDLHIVRVLHGLQNWQEII